MGGGDRATTLTSPQDVLSAYRPALGLITVISAAGALVAISGLRRSRREIAVDRG